jgi:PPOX class probable F420-dependent enzyme
MADKAHDLLEYCRSKNLAWVGTSSPDGRPQVTPVWVDVIDGKPAFNTAVGRAKEKHLRANPNISLAILKPGDEYTAIEVQGTATLTTDGADEFIDALAKKYLDADSYPFRAEGEQRITVIIEPERYFGQG